MEKNMIALLVAVLILACLNLSAQGEFVVFDGKDAVKGQTWADPKDSVAFGLSTVKPCTGKSSHLDLNAKWSNWWAGGGWNWHGWYDTDASPGDDISSYDDLSLSICLYSGSIKDLWIQLVDTANKSTSMIKLKESGIADSFGAEYKTVAIPLSKFDMTGFNKKNVWGINFGIIPQTQAGECRIFIGKIEFLKKLPAPIPVSVPASVPAVK